MTARIRLGDFCANCGLDNAYGIHHPSCKVSHSASGSTRRQRTVPPVGYFPTKQRRRRVQLSTLLGVAPARTSSSVRGNRSPVPLNARQRAGRRDGLVRLTGRRGRVTLLGATGAVLLGASLAALLVAPSWVAVAGLVTVGAIAAWEATA